MTWPTFFIAGVEKSGSTSFWNYLKDTDNVFMSNPKAPGFFHGNRKKHVVDKESEYLKLFKNSSNNKAIGEATVSYFTNPDSAKLIKHKVPNAKIIILLRNPIERAFSHFLMYSSKGLEKESFHTIVQKYRKNLEKGNTESNIYLDPSFYFEHVKRYIDIFGKDNVKIIILEEFLKNPKLEFRELLDFLGVDSNIPDTINEKFGEYAKGKGEIHEKILKSKLIIRISRMIPRSLRWKMKRKYLLEKKLEINKEDYEMLQEMFTKNIEDLEKLLEQKFSWFSDNMR